MKLESKHVGRGRYAITFRGADGRVEHVDELLPTNAAQRERFVERVGKQLPVLDLEQVGRQLLELADRGDDQLEPSNDEPKDAPEDRDSALEALGSGDLMDQIRADLGARGLAADLDVALLAYLAFTSRLLKEPVSVFAQGPSSSGKTYVGKVVSELMPPESVFDVQGITPQALFYLDDRLRHSVVMMGEWARDEDQTDDGIRTAALRQLISDGRLSKLFTNTESGRPETEQATTEGPVAVYATSTLPMSRIFEEDANRFLFVHTDETEQATRLVMGRKADDAAGNAQADDDQLERIKRRHHAMQRELRSRAAPVVFPLAPRLSDLFPADQPRRRRDLSKVFGLVKSSALLHQRLRTRDAAGRIVATIEDYRIVHQLLTPFMVKDTATPATLRKHEELRAALDPGQSFKRADAQRIWDLGKARAAEVVGELREAGLLTDANADYTYRLLPVGGERRTFLPDVALVATGSCMECA